MWQMTYLINSLQCFWLGIIYTEGIDGHGFDNLRLCGAVTPVCRNFGDLVHNVHALNDFSEGGVLSVQVICGFVHDKELAACRIRI